MMQFLMRLQVIPKVLERPVSLFLLCTEDMLFVYEITRWLWGETSKYQLEFPGIYVFIQLLEKKSTPSLSSLVLRIRTRGQTVTKRNKSDPQIPESDYNRQRTAKCVPTVSLNTLTPPSTYLQKHHHLQPEWDLKTRPAGVLYSQALTFFLYFSFPLTLLICLH